MSLTNTPIMNRFFSNKIESSRAEWGDYLLEIADVYSMFDGEDLDRNLIEDRFSSMSGRSPYAFRDFSNFRDEFGAYSCFLGVFHYKKIDGAWKLYLSKAAKHFLCSTEPDVEGFCRTQLSLYQYPNGAGAGINKNIIHVQGNAKKCVVSDIRNHIRINPLRLLCRIVVAFHEYLHVQLQDIFIPFKTIYLLFNDTSINQQYSPPYDNILSAIQSFESLPLPDWAKKDVPQNFKRNFHIMSRTGIFSNNRNKGLRLDERNLDKAYEYANAIASMTQHFIGFDQCYDSPQLEEDVKRVIEDMSWGEYYDALSLPMSTLSLLSDNVAFADIDFSTTPIGTVDAIDYSFPDLKAFQANQIRAFVRSSNETNPLETLVRREKANREHARILSMLAANIRLKGYEAYENTFIDLHSATVSTKYIFEVKSNNSKNALSQIRKAIAQLYEYRYRSEMNDAVLCIVLQQKPIQSWVEDYLLHDRGILYCWLVDEVRLECPSECHASLSEIGVVE